MARNWKNTDFYERPKIGIRETGSRIIACLDTENRYFLSSLYTVYPKGEYDLNYLKCLLGILNSKLASFIVSRISFDLTEGAFTKVRTNQLGRLPIPSNFLDYVDSISTIVSVIIDGESTNHEPIISLENEIDGLVYELYELSEEEINLIEHGKG